MSKPTERTTDQPAKHQPEKHKPRSNAASNGGTTTSTQVKGVAGEEDPLDIKRPRHG